MPLTSEHAQAIARPRRLTLRERRLIAGVLALVAPLVVALIISITTTGSASGRGCIHATIPGAVGAQEIDQCGEQARATCQTVKRPGALPAPSARVLVAQCRKAGLRVGG